MPNSLVKRKGRGLATNVGCPRNLGMRICACLAGIDQHALHTSTASKPGSLAKPYSRWSLQSSRALTFLSRDCLKGSTFCHRGQHCQADVCTVWLQPSCSLSSGAMCSMPHELDNDTEICLLAC
jgi:hypothetical protein